MEFDINAFVKSLDMDHIAMVLLSIALVICICSYWGLWHMFKKMGMAGWKCLIPVYSTWIVFKIIWKSSVFWFQLSIGIMVNLLPASNIPYKTLIGIIGIAVDAVITLMLHYKLSRAFGHGILFTLGLCICPPLFYMILGLGNSKFELFAPKKLRMTTITLKGQEYPIHNFDHINKLMRSDKKAAAVVELSKMIGITYEEAVEILDKWYLYYY